MLISISYEANTFVKQLNFNQIFGELWRQQKCQGGRDGEMNILCPPFVSCVLGNEQNT